MTPLAGSFATSRRGGLTALQCAEIRDLARGVGGKRPMSAQNIAQQYGAPMEDVRRIIQGEALAAVPISRPIPPEPKWVSWTDEERHRLTLLLQARVPPAEIARIMDRSIGAVHQQTHKLKRAA